jgi:hypothetical protein
LATPKSTSFTLPLVPIRMLCGEDVAMHDAARRAARSELVRACTEPRRHVGDDRTAISAEWRGACRPRR